MAVAGHRQLDLHRRVFDHRDGKAGQGHHHHPPGLHHGDGVAGAIKKEFFDCRQLGLPGADQLAQVVGDFDHALAFALAGIGADHAAIEQALTASDAPPPLFEFDDAVAHPGQAGINTEDSHGGRHLGPCWGAGRGGQGGWRV